MRILTLDELEILPPEPCVLAVEDLEESGRLPRRAPLTRESCLVGGLVDWVNAVLLDTFRCLDRTEDAVITVDFDGEETVSERKMALLMDVVQRAHPNAVAVGLSVQLPIPALSQATLRLAAAG